MKSQTYIGTELFFDESGYSRTSLAWDTKLIPAIQKVVGAYNKLGMGAFSQETLDSLNTGRQKEIERKYAEALEADLIRMEKDYKILPTVFADDSTETQVLVEFRKAVEDFKAVLNSVYDSQLGYRQLNHDDLKIVKGFPTVDKAEIKKRLTTVIDSDEKAEFYALLLDTTKAYNNLRSFVDKYRGKNQLYPTAIIPVNGVPGFSGFILEDDNGSMEIIPENFNNLFN